MQPRLHLLVVPSLACTLFMPSNSPRIPYAATEHDESGWDKTCPACSARIPLTTTMNDDESFDNAPYALHYETRRAHHYWTGVGARRVATQFIRQASRTLGIVHLGFGDFRTLGTPEKPVVQFLRTTPIPAAFGGRSHEIYLVPGSDDEAAAARQQTVYAKRIEAASSTEVSP
jgi:hypothetical protein